MGIIGALDPHTHKTNLASLSGEGKLEKEGVRPLRLNNAAMQAAVQVGCVGVVSCCLCEGKLEKEGVRPLRLNNAAMQAAVQVC